MTSSGVNGEVRQGWRLKKMGTRYFSFKWKTEGGESTSGRNSENFRSSEEVLEGSGRIGFFRSIKKKLSIKNLCRSKRKITAAELSRGVDDGGSERTVSLTNDKYETEVNERVGIPSDLTESSISQSSTDSLRRRTDNSRFDSNDEERICESSVRGNVNRGEESADRLNQLWSEGAEGGAEYVGEEMEMEMDEEEKGNLPTLSQELLKLSKYGWYWGPISGDEADAKLQAEPDGAFLIRDSSDDRHLLTLSFKSAGKLLHARVEHSGGMFSFCNQGDSGRFTSVPALIDHSMNYSRSAVFCYSRPRYPGHPAFPVRLTKPVSRFRHVRSLQYLCRFVIRQNTRLDNINKLPLPNTIKGYIEEAHY
ncbi:suppressor of cytokine signaling 4 [Fopius arisanus]|uniref:SOCS6 protein n=1 Tax=Fopius arisanus TaxID=64838 RepID=A0A0C9RJS4_9HYME|nr:PREDICTED: suppressor of cytokine signaling 4 [Fopius arisanus]